MCGVIDCSIRSMRGSIRMSSNNCSVIGYLKLIRSVRIDSIIIKTRSTDGVIGYFKIRLGRGSS